jgi:hypothetical protein
MGSGRQQFVFQPLHFAFLGDITHNPQGANDLSSIIANRPGAHS